MTDTATAPDTAADPALLAQLASLDGAAQVAEQPAVPGAELPPPPAPIDYKAEARELLDFVILAIEPLYPTLAQVYAEPVRERIATAAGPVLQKHGIDLGGLFGAWGPEIGLAMTVLPLIAPTVAAIRADRAAAAAEQQQTAPPGQGGAMRPGVETGAASPMAGFPADGR